MAQYGKKTYWDERYTKDPEPFDWYQRYAGLKEIFEDRIKTSDQILVVGSGNSPMSEEMYEDEYENITNIDFSSVVVKAMTERAKDQFPRMTYQVMDAMAMDFGSAYFDSVIDKACTDAILCGEGSTQNIAKYYAEVARVLKPNGIFIVVSYGVPEHRMVHLDKPEFGWTVEIVKVAKPSIGNVQPEETDSDNVHYLYTCKKGRKGGKK